MGERFRFDQRVAVPEVPSGKTVVKFFGLPQVVSAPLPGEKEVGNSGLFPSQVVELASKMLEVGISPLREQKRMVARGQTKGVEL